jgi:membrane protease YdiL (CAAX protease family)
LTSLLFALSHAINVNDVHYNDSYVLLQIIMAFVIGLLYTFTLMSTGYVENAIFFLVHIHNELTIAIENISFSFNV